MSERPTAYICTSFERLKKFIEFISSTEWDRLSRQTQKDITAGYIMHGDKTAVAVEPNGTVSFFEVGQLPGFEYRFFIPESKNKQKGAE